MKRPYHRSERTCADGALSFKMMGLMTGLFAVLAVTLPAADPAWWGPSGRGAINYSTGTNSGVVVNQGQVKQFTVKAAQELNADLTNNGGAGPALSNLVYGWHQDYLTNGYETNTANPYRPYKGADYDAVALGQLKYIASLIYGQLSAAGYAGLYPSWIVQDPANDNNAATVGQLKTVFNFDLSLAGPSNLTASANTSGSITLNWSVPTNNPASSYLVEQQNSDGTWSVIATITSLSQTSYTVSNLATGEQPTFQIISQNGNRFSVPAATPPDPGLTAPTNMQAVHGATDGEIDLSWFNTATDATYIYVEQSPDGINWSTIAQLPPTATSYAVTGLTVGNSYYFQLEVGNN